MIPTQSINDGNDIIGVITTSSTVYISEVIIQGCGGSDTISSTGATLNILAGDFVSLTNAGVVLTSSAIVLGAGSGSAYTYIDTITYKANSNNGNGRVMIIGGSDTDTITATPVTNGITNIDTITICGDTCSLSYTSTTGSVTIQSSNNINQ